MRLRLPRPGDAIPGDPARQHRSGLSRWQFLDRVDPGTLSYPDDAPFLKRVSKEFVHCSRFEFDSHAQLATLLRVLQLVIRALSSENAARGRELSAARRARAAEGPRARPRARLVVADRCPLCGLGFRTVFYLDQHIFARHAAHAEIWRALRTPRAPAAPAVAALAVPPLSARRRPPAEGALLGLRAQLRERDGRIAALLGEQAARLGRLRVPAADAAPPAREEEALLPEEEAPATEEEEEAPLPEEEEEDSAPAAGSRSASAGAEDPQALLDALGLSGDFPESD